MQAPVSHKKIIIWASIATTLMFCFCFAVAPFYSIICRATGISTSIPTKELISITSAKQGVDTTRTITVQFVATNHMGMPWDFYPRTTSVTIHPGENKKVYFYARNMTNKPMIVQAIPSMTPTEAMSHFHKIECFCFRQQALKAREDKNMPLIFNVDKNLPKDIRVITLAYTLFDVTPKVSKRDRKDD